MTTYTVAYWEANQSTLDAGSPFTITDTAADISAAFDALDQDTHISQLIVSDNAAVTVSTNQLFVTDTHAIGILKNANNTAYTLVVNDTGANITTYLNNLQGNTHVTTIVVASGTVDATVAQLASDSTALSNLKTSVGGSQASIAVNDTSAHLHSGWANVAADSQVSSIVISDNTQLSLTATQASQTSAVEKLVYANSVTSNIVLVKDTAAHIESDLASLEIVSTFIASVTVSDSTFETLSASQVTSYLAVLEKVVFQSGTATFSVSDSSTAVSANLDALQALSGSISSIAVTDNAPITVSIAQLADDSNALSLITYHSNPISVAVADTGSNISGNLATLEAAIQAESPPISSISVTSGVINTTVTQLNSDSAVFAALTGSYTLDVTDNASNISSALNTLQTFAQNGDISAINVTDSGNIAVTVAQITSDANAISELVNNDTNPYTLAVTDSVAHIQPAFTSLGSNSHIAAITFTDSSPVLTITASQFINGLAVLGEITNASFTVDVTGATSAQAATIATDFAGLANEADATLSIAVSDTASSITSHLVALGSNAYVATIVINDSNPITLTESQFTNSGDDAGLAKISGNYTVDVTGVTVAQVSTVEGDAVNLAPSTPTLSIAVSDTGANITSAALTSLGSDSSVTSISVSSGHISLTESQFTSSGVDAGLAKLAGSNTVIATGVTVSQISTVEGVTLGGSATLNIDVSDTGANISAALSSLGGNNLVAAISLTSGVLTLTEANYTSGGNYGVGLGKMTGAYTVDVTAVTVAEVSTVEGVTGLGGTPTLSIAVSDLGPNITNAALQGLGSDSKVTSISVSDGKPIGLTEAQYTNSNTDTGLGKMTGTYTVDVTGVTVAQVSTVEGVTGLGGTPTLSIAVSDSGLNITDSALQTLGADSNVTSIAINDSNPIVLTEAQATGSSEDAGLAKMTGSYTVDVSGATAAQVASIESVVFGGTPTLSIAVTDVGGNFNASNLSTLGADSNVTSIAVSSGAIVLSETNFTNAGTDAGLAKMTGAYAITATGVTVAQVSTVEGTSLGGTPTLSIKVSDIGSNYTSTALSSLGGSSTITVMAVSSGAITLTEAQYTNSGVDAGLAKINGSFTVDVTGVTVAQVSTVESQTGVGTPTLAIAVADTGANITASKLISLGADSKVASISVTSGFLTLTQGQYASASSEYPGLEKMTGTYSVDVTGCGVAFVSTVEGLAVGGTPSLSIAVVDTGARITSVKLVSFGTDSKVTSIAVTSGAISLTEAQFTAVADHLGLAKLIGAYTIDVTGVTASEVATVENINLTGTPTLSIAVSDTGANLSGTEFGTLGSDTHVTSIAVTSGAMTFTELQFTSYEIGFAKMTGAYTVDVTGVTVAQVSGVEGESLGGTPTLSIAVADSGSNITDSALQTLGADGKVASISSTGGIISLTETQFVGTAEQSGLAKMTGAYSINVALVTVAELSTVEGKTLGGTPSLTIDMQDVGANFTSAALSTLGADSKVLVVSVSSGTITLTESQFTTSSVDTGLGKMNGSYTIAVTGVLVSQIATVEGTTLGGTPTLQIAVSDSGANLSNLQFAALGSDSRVTSIAVSSGTLSLTDTQFSADSAGLAKLTGAYAIQVTGATVAQVSTVEGTSLSGTPTLTITVADSGSNVTDSALQTLGADSHVVSISVTGGSLSLTETQFVGSAEQAGLAKMTGSYGITVSLVTVAEVATVEGEALGGTPSLSINVKDVASNLTSPVLSTLGADSKVSHIVVSSGTITLTELQFTNASVDAGFAKMNGSYTVAVTGVTASQVATVEAVSLNGSPTLQISVSDTGPNLTAAALTSLGSDSNITSIATSSPIVLTEAQYTTSSVDAGLAKMTGVYTVDVTGVLVSQVSTVEAVTGLGGTPTLSIAVSDTGADVTAGKLITLGADSKVTSIAITSGAIMLTQSQYASTSNEYPGLQKMTGAYTVDVSSVGVAFVATVEGLTVGGTPTLSIAVADIGARFTPAELTTLGGDSHVTSITVTSGVITLTEPQFVASGEHAGLAKMLGTYTVDVTNVTVAKVATVEAVTGLGGTPTLAIAVSDTGADLTNSALSTLGADSKVSSIAVTSGAIALTEAQYTNSGVDAGLAKMTGSFTVDVSGVTAAQVATVEGVDVRGTVTLSIAVTDTGGDLTSSVLTTLGADSNVTSIAVTSGAIGLTGTQYLTSGVEAGLAKIGNAYTVDVSSVTVAQVSAVEAYHAGSVTLSIAVSDTGGDITNSALSTLGADSKIASISVTSGSVNLTEAQFTTSSVDAGLAKMLGDYNIDVRSVTAAQVVTVEGVALGGTPTLSIAVSDSGANLTSVELVSLGSNANVTSVAVTNGPIVLTETQFTNSSDIAGLVKVTGNYTVDITGVTVAQVSTVEGVNLVPSTPTLSIAVSDTGGNVSSALSTLGADSDVTSIALSSGVIALSEANYTNSGYDAGLAKMAGTYTVDVSGVTVAQVSAVESVSLGGTPTLSIAVSDAGANVTSSALTTLGADSKVTSIALTGGAIALTEAQYTNASDDAGLAKMTGSYTVDVSGVTVAQVPTVESVTGLGGTPSLSIAVSDTGAHITSAALISLGADNDVTSITDAPPPTSPINGDHVAFGPSPLNGGPITLTEAQYTASADDAGLAKMIGAYTVDVTGVSAAQVAAVEAVTGLGGTPTLSIAVTDIGGNFSADTLASLGSDPDVTSITVSSGVISLSEATFTNANVDAGLDKVAGNFTVDVSGVQVSQIGTVEGITLSSTPTLSIAVSDTGSAISGDFSNLGSDGDVTSIAVSSGVISLPVADFFNSNDLAALTKMTGSYTVDVSGASVANVALVEGETFGGTPTLSIGVSDAASNITDAVLQTLGADANVTSIAINDSNPISLTEAQFTGSAEDAGLAKMVGAYTVDVSGVTVAQVSIVEGQTGLGGTPSLSLAVSDVGGNFTSSALTSFGTDADIASITVTSGAIILSEAHFVTSSVDAGLDRISGSFTVDVTGVTVAQVSTVEGITLTSSPTLSIAVNDIGGNVTDSALQTLGADGDVTSIFISSGAIALTAAQFLGTAELTGLAKMTGHYTVDVSGATAAQVTTIDASSLGGIPALSITVSDTGADLANTVLSSLGANGNVASITDTSGAIALTEAQFVNPNVDAGLAKMIGSYTVDVSGVHVAQVSTVENQTGLGGTPTLSIAVSDTGANINDAALQTLGADGDVASIAVSSGAISLTETQVTGSAEDAGLAKMTGTYTLDVSGVSVAEVSTVEGLSFGGTPTLSIAVNDTGSAITSDFGTLGSDADITSIAVSSGVISLAESAYIVSNDLAALGKMTGTYTVDVSGVTVAEISTVEGATYGGTPTLSIAVSDVGTNITSSALVSMGSDSDIASIAVTSGAVSVTEAQFIAAADVRGIEKITGSFTVDVTGTTVAQVSTVTTDFGNLTNSGDGTLAIYVADTAAHVANNAPALNTNTAVISVAVTDTAAHVAVDLDILNGVEALTAITFTDVSPALALTESTFVGGLLALDTIQNTGVAMSVTGATASQAATVASDYTGLTDDSNFSTFTIAVADNSTNVANNASTLNANSYVTSIHVTDTVANIEANISGLDAVTELNAVTLTNATPALVLTAAQVLASSGVLGDVTNGAFTVDATGASAAQAATIASELSGLSDASHITYAIGVSDTATHIAAALNSLETEHVNSLTINDSGPLNITYAQFQADGSVLSTLTGTDTVNVSGVTGQAYSSFTDTYINGAVAETIENNTNGSTTAIGYANGLTFTPAGPSAHVESINTTGYHLESFDFSGSFGNVSITGFSLANDAIQFSSAEFANVAAVEQHTTQVNGNAVVTLDSGDTITMVGITMNSFEAHSTDWTFV